MVVAVPSFTGLYCGFAAISLAPFLNVLYQQLQLKTLAPFHRSREYFGLFVHNNLLFGHKLCMEMQVVDVSQHESVVFVAEQYSCLTVLAEYDDLLAVVGAWSEYPLENDFLDAFLLGLAVEQRDYA